VNEHGAPGASPDMNGATFGASPLMDSATFGASPHLHDATFGASPAVYAPYAVRRGATTMAG
jgi:hypothetical protein